MDHSSVYQQVPSVCVLYEQLKSPGMLIVSVSIDFVVVLEIMTSVTETLHCMFEQNRSPQKKSSKIT